MAAARNDGEGVVSELDGDVKADDPVGESESDDTERSGIAPTSEELALCPPLPEAPMFEAPPGFVVNLEPMLDCRHPEVVADCENGFCRIPPGCFIMGAPRDEFDAARNSDVQVQVTLTRAFEIGTFEVTNEMWLAEGFELPLREEDLGVCRDAACPISNVNLYETLTYINRYSENRGLEPCYDLKECGGTFGSGPICNKAGDRPGTLVCERTEQDGLNCEGLYTTAASVYECEGYRLPTEAEWEYAARAGTRTGYWTGPVAWGPVLGDCLCDPNLEPIAWYCHNSGHRQHHVGEKPSNPWGLYDVLGNVDEWTADMFYGLGYGTSPQVDPAGYWWENGGKAERDLMPVVDYGGQLVKQDNVVNRGGNYTYAASLNKASERNTVLEPHQGASVRGFRMARTLRD